MAKKAKRAIRLAGSTQNPFSLFRSEVTLESGLSVKKDDVFDPDGGSETYEQRDLEDFSITSEVEAVLSDTNIVARDMKVDDSSMEQAKSFWHWCTDSQFLGEHVTPYLEQALIGIKLFGEYCPSCSNVEWMQDENHKPQEGLNGIRKHVQPLEYGVCPKCDARRSDMIKNGELSFYNELAVNAGQRCVTGDTAVVVTGGKYGTEQRKIHIGKLLPEDYDGGTGFYDLPKGTQVYGRGGFEDTDRIFISRVDELWEIKTKLGDSLVGTREHPVWRESTEGEEGFCDLKDIKVGEKVMTLLGWSTVIHSQVSERRERTYDLHVPSTHDYFTNGILSHNSGKSIVVALISTYITHRVLMMQKPTEIYRVGPNQMLHGAFVALTAGQAKDTLWEPYYGYILESPWFKKYHALLDFYQQKYKQTIYKVMDSYILYRHRNLFVHYAGPDKRVLRGRTRIFACVGEDELVSTDRGLVKMQDIEDGMIANIGHRTGSIRNHTMTGEKEVKKLVLESGQELLATDLHKICVVRDDKFKKVKIKNLRVTDKVCVGLGSQYPDSLELPTYNVDQCLFDTVVDVFMTNAMVDYELLESVTGSPRNPLTAFVSKLVKSGAVEKHYRKGKMVVGMSRCYFTIADSDILQTFYTDTRSLKFPTQMTPELAEFIGMLLADGNLRDSKQKGVWFGSTHRDRIERFTKLSYDLFGWKNHITTDRREDKDFWKSTLCNRHVISYLRTLGLDAVYSADKEIPWCILQAPRSSVRACIKAMYMCDGSVSYGQVRYSSTSKRMLLQLQQMLLREGYPTKLRDCQVSEDSCRKYTYTTNKYGDDRTIVTRMLVADSAVSWSMRTLTGRKPKRVSCKVHYFEKSRRKNIVLTSIKGVEETNKKMKVYDMTVDHRRHAYQASGMLVSNSIDEIGWFDNSKDSGKVKVDASEVYIALERSLLTCRSAEEYQLGLDYDQCFSAYFLNISSPSSVRDKICELVRLSEGSTKLLGLHKPTWEMNPNVPQDSPIIIEAYRKDPVTAERDYGANPPLSSNPFIRSRSMVMDCMKEKGRNFIKYSQQIYRAKDGGKYRYGTVQKIKQSTQPSIMAIDAGLTNNSFAMVVGTKDGANINLDLLIEIMPLPGIPLHYTMIYEHLILPVIEARNIRVLLADRWNSVKLLQDAEAQSDRLQVAKSYSVKYSDLWNTKASIESGRMKYPRSEEQDVDKILGFDPDNYPRCFTGKEAEHLILQMLTVQDTGKQVIKGENLTDDIWRAAVLLEWGLNNPDFDEHMTVDEGNKYKAGVIGVSRRGLVTSSNSGKIRTQGTKFLSVRSSRK